MNKKFKFILSIISIFSLCTCTTLAFAAKVPGAPTQVTPNSGPVGPAPTTPITTTVNGTPGGPAPVPPVKDLATVVYTKGTLGLFHATLDGYGTVRKVALGIPETPAFDLAVDQTSTGSNNLYLAYWNGSTLSWKLDTISNNNLNARVTEQIPITFPISTNAPTFITLKLGRDQSGQILPVVAATAVVQGVNHSELAYRRNGIWTVVPIISPAIGQYTPRYPGLTLINNLNGVTTGANVVNQKRSPTLTTHLEESNVTFLAGTSTAPLMITQPVNSIDNFRVSNGNMVASSSSPTGQYCSQRTSQWFPLTPCYQPSGTFYDLFYDPNFLPMISAGTRLTFLTPGGTLIASIGIDNNLAYNWLQKAPLNLPKVYSVGVSRASTSTNDLNLYVTNIMTLSAGTTQSINIESIPLFSNMEAKIVPLQ